MEIDTATIPTATHSSPRPDAPHPPLSVPPWARALCPRLETSRALPCAFPEASAHLNTHVGPGHSLASATLTGVGSLSPGAFQAVASGAILAVLGAVAGTAAPHPVRVWNFIPDIHRPMRPGMDRYRLFNAARFKAFAQWFGAADAPTAATFAAALPAASGVGHDADELSIHALGAALPGRSVENPRQTPAFEYSTAHGPRPPCFSRAMIADLASTPHHPMLLVSGTASIRGEDSTHDGHLGAQFDESVANLEQLAGSIRGPYRFALSGVETARVYHSRTADRAWLEHAVRSRLPRSAWIDLVPAALCRRELLVEIEATIRPTAAGACGGACNA